MPKVVNGTPISILRYGLDNKKHSLVSFDYRDNKKEFKIKSSYIDRLNVIIETNKRNIPIGSEVYHNLLFYESIVKNMGTTPKPLKVYENKNDYPLSVKIRWNDQMDIGIEIDPYYTGIDYGTSFCIFNSNYKPAKVKEYILTDYGIVYNEYINESCESKVIVLSELGNINKEISYLDFVRPISTFSHRIKSLELRPKLININDNEIIQVEYNYHGLVKSIDSDAYICEYSLYEEDRNKIMNSTTTLMFDIFNPKNYFNNKLVVDEFLVTYTDSNVTEFMQVIYDDVQSIDDADSKMYKFSDYVSKYFNY